MRLNKVERVIVRRMKKYYNILETWRFLLEHQSCSSTTLCQFQIADDGSYVCRFSPRICQLFLAAPLELTAFFDCFLSLLLAAQGKPALLAVAQGKVASLAVVLGMVVLLADVFALKHDGD